MVKNPEKKERIEKRRSGLEDNIRLYLVPQNIGTCHIPERKIHQNSHSSETISSQKYENTVSSLVRSNMFRHRTIKY